MKTTIFALALMLILAGCTSPAQEVQVPEEPAQPPVENDTPEAPVEQTPEEPEAPEPEVPEAPEEPVEEPEEPSLPLTSKTSEELLDSALDELTSDFYRDHSGMFTENRHRWIVNTPVDDGFLTVSPASQVEFDGSVIESVKAVGHVIFEKDGDEDIYGAAVFSAQATMLDSMFAPFDIDMFSGRDLEWCQITKKDVYQKSGGGFISVYWFECESAS